MTSKSYREQIKELLRTWKAIPTTNLRQLLSQSSTFNQRSFEWALSQMRRRQELHTLRIGRDYLNFSSAWKKRFILLHSVPPHRREATLEATGLQHHFELLEIFLLLKRKFSTLNAYPNLSNQTSIFSRSLQGGKQFPDLVLRENIHSPSIYVELERNLKSEKRYLEKWRAYERDRNVYACLYWLTESSHLRFLLKLVREFFDRRSGRSSFFLGLVTMEAFQTKGFDSRVILVGLNEDREVGLQEILSGPVSKHVASPNQKIFSPPTTEDDWAISALRANSSPTTISNEWVLKDVREEFARRAP